MGNINKGESMKNFKRVLIIIFLLISLIYVTNITSIPDSVLLFKEETLNLGTVFGISIKEKESSIETIEASKILNNYVEEKEVALSLFNIIPVKKVKVNTIENTKVIPLGNTVRLKAIYRRSISSRKNRYRR